MRGTRPLLLGAASIIAFFPGGAGSSESCTKRELRARTTETISLDGLNGGVREQAAFYLRDTQRNLVFFFKPEHVLKLLEDRFVNANSSDRDDFANTLDRVRHDLPLKEDTDLFKYGVRDSSFYARLDYLVSELLDAGHAMIDYYPLHDSGRHSLSANDQYDPVTLKRVYWANRGGNGREYCSEEGRAVLAVVDEIND